MQGISHTEHIATQKSIMTNMHRDILQTNIRGGGDWSTAFERYHEYFFQYNLGNNWKSVLIFAPASLILYSWMWTLSMLICSEVCKSLHFLLDNIFVRYSSTIYRKVIGIPMGTNCAQIVKEWFLQCYERDFIIYNSNCEVIRLIILILLV